TPDAGSLQRDALLFAAGRGSARPNRGWKMLAAVLAGTQVLSLALLWPHAVPPAGSPAVQVAATPAPSAVEQAASHRWANRGVMTAHGDLSEVKSEDRPDDTVTFIDTGPPMRAFGSPPASILN